MSIVRPSLAAAFSEADGYDNELILSDLGESAAPFLDRLDEIQQLSAAIQDQYKVMAEKRRKMAYELLQEPFELRIPVPWQGNKEVEFDEAIPLFRDRHEKLWEALWDPTLSEEEHVKAEFEYEKFLGLKSYLINYTTPQFSQHKERILKQFPFVEEKEKISQLSYKLNHLVREYQEYSIANKARLGGGNSSRKSMISEIENMHVLPHLTYQNKAAARIQRAFRQYSRKSDPLITDLSGIKSVFVDYCASQATLQNLKETLANLESEVFTIQNVDGEMEWHNLKSATDQYQSRLDEGEDLEESDFEFLFFRKDQWDAISKSIEDQKMLLDQQLPRVQEARSEWGVIMTRVMNSPPARGGNEIMQFINDISLLNLELAENE